MPNPLVVTDRYVDADGALVYGEPVPAGALAEAKALMGACAIDLAPLDAAVAALSAQAAAARCPTA